MEQSATLQTQRPKIKKKRKGNRWLTASIVGVGVLCLIVVALMAWTLLGDRSVAPKSAAQRDVITAEAAMSAKPNDFQARLDAANANTAAGKYDRAVTLATLALNMDKAQAAYVWLAIGQAQAAKGDIARARTSLGKVVVTQLGGQDQAGFYAVLASMDVKQGKFAGAASNLQKATVADPTNTDYLVLLADNQVRAGQKDAAIITYQKALQYVPDLKAPHDALVQMKYGPASYVLARMAWDAGNKAQAKRMMELALTQSPDLPWLNVALGDFRALNGDVAGAKAAYNHALALDPADKEAKAGLAAISQ
jgi:tetratricopeptide (TPR) repeat protein